MNGNSYRLNQSQIRRKSRKPEHRGLAPTGARLSRKTALAMAFKPILSARREWRKLDGSDQLADVIEGAPFKDGIKLS